MIPTLALFTAVILIATLMPLSRHTHWLIRGLDFPRLQFSIFTAALLVAHFTFLDIQTISTKGLIFCTCLCLIWQLWWILPYTRLWPKEVSQSINSEAEKQLSIITSNVLTPNRSADSLINLVNKHQPDVLVTLESDQWWEDRLQVLKQDMPYSIKCPLDNLYGMHVFSKLPISEEEICYLVEKDVPSIHAQLKLPSGDKVRFHFLHPAPPSPTENTESAERDAELMIVARSVAESNQPVIVTGDLNDVAWSATTRLFRKVSGLLDPRIGRGIFSTFHADYPLIRWPLDHLFHSQHFTLQGIQRLPSIGSDHFPLLTRLAYSPSQAHSQQGIEADAPEQQRSKDISKDQKVSKSDVPEPGETTIKNN